MSNSSLVTYKKISPNRTSPRNKKIDMVIIHCIVGQWTAKQGCDHFASVTNSSVNYVVGKDGSIGLSVEEKDRAWTSGGTDSNGNPIRVNGISGADIDHRAVTIEVASDTYDPYRVTDEAYKALINLLVDICQRNDIKELKWSADKSLVGQVYKQNMAVHRWFAYKSCPGDYLYNLHGEIAKEVNSRLKSMPESSDEEDYGVYSKGVSTKLSKNFQSTEFDCHGKGCCTETYISPKLVDYLQTIRDHFGKSITITSGYRCPTHNSTVSKATNSYHTRKDDSAADFVVSGVTPREVAKYAESLGIKGIGLYETNSDGHFVHIDTRTSKSFWYGQAESPVTTFGGTASSTPKEEVVETPKESVKEENKYFSPYVVRVSVTNLNMRTGPSTSHNIIGYIPKGAYTIVEESGKWGRLKSKQKYKGKSTDAWIHLDYTKKL